MHVVVLHSAEDAPTGSTVAAMLRPEVNAMAMAAEEAVRATFGANVFGVALVTNATDPGDVETLRRAVEGFSGRSVLYTIEGVPVPLALVAGVGDRVQGGSDPVEDAERIRRGLKMAAKTARVRSDETFIRPRSRISASMIAGLGAGALFLTLLTAAVTINTGDRRRPAPPPAEASAPPAVATETIEAPDTDQALAPIAPAAVASSEQQALRPLAAAAPRAQRTAAATTVEVAATPEAIVVEPAAEPLDLRSTLPTDPEDTVPSEATAPSASELPG